MAIDAIVASMDHVSSAIDDVKKPAAMRERRKALKRACAF